MATILTLLQKVNYLDEGGQRLIEKAYAKAEVNHRGVFRKSGEPFIQHPLKVALKLADLNMDAETIAAALLHDLHEDSGISLKELQNEFGSQIAEMVNGVSKLHRVKLGEEDPEAQTERQIEALRKMFVSMAKDLRVVLIKLADRWHNLETLFALPPKKQKEIALETLKIYAPLAYRLGMGEIKGILEDLAFPYAYPEEYEELKKMALPKYEVRKKYIEKVKKILADDLKEAKIEHEIHGRAKHMYSLYKKLKKYDYDMDKIYDLVALRVIVSEIHDCYAVLGLIHKRWKPLLGRIKDYIAIPKPNGYQSLHTTVFCQDGEIVEFQIRTKKMHEKAEYGVAAHWHYTEQTTPKEFKQGAIRTEKATLMSENELRWVKELTVWQKELKDSKDFFEALKLDLFKDRIFVFTPKGDVVDLPEGATPIDFAYYIHTDIGNSAFGAKVNGKMLSLSAELKNGDIVEILTAKNIKPSQDWLRIVKTAKARERIKSWLKKATEV